MSLTYGKVGFRIGGTQDETTTLVDLALTAFDDERVTYAYVHPSFASMSGSRAITELNRYWAAQTVVG